MSDQTIKRLVHYAREDYEGSFTTDILEQYKLYVQSAENVSARRVASSRYLLTLNVALVALYGLQSANFGQTYWTLLVPLIGIPISLLWHQIIKSHRDLNTVKFEVIHELEQHLPAALFGYEWQIAEQGRGKSYNPVTYIERWIPIAFAVLHMVITIVTVLSIVALMGMRGMNFISEYTIVKVTLSSIACIC